MATGNNGLAWIADAISREQVHGKDLYSMLQAAHEDLHGEGSCTEEEKAQDSSTDDSSQGEDQESSTQEDGEHGRLDRLRFCHWAAPEYGSKGETLWTNLWEAAQLAISLLNAKIQGDIADKQEELAQKYYDQAKYKWDRFEGKYMPLEKSILWEASSEPIKEMDCADDQDRAHWAVTTAYAYANDYMTQVAKQYRLCLDPTVVNQMQYAQNVAEVDTINYNLRDDQWFVDFKNDQRWNRRSNILNLGRNLGSVAMQYGDVARKLMGDVGDIANKAFGSISQALGYYGARFDTVYPTSYLAGSVSFGNRSLLSSPASAGLGATQAAMGGGVTL